MEREAGQSKKEYLSHLRHELRTPLNAIIGYAAMLQEDAEDLNLNHYIPRLQEIIELGNRLTKSIDSIMYSKEIEESPETVDTSSLKLTIRDGMEADALAVVRKSQDLAFESSASGDTDLTADLEKIHAASNQLVRMVKSIAQEAALAPPTKPGAAKNAKERQSDLYNGVISAIQSTVDAHEAMGTQGGYILLVDDNELNRDVLSRQLMRQGHQVNTADNGLMALDMLRAEDYDLVLLDVMMPVMDGISTLREIKTDSNLSYLPVIMLSAVQDLEKVVECIEIGAEDYLPKPVEKILLKARINATLEKKRLRDREVMYLRQIEAEKKNSEELLRVILPEEIVAELQDTHSVTPRRYNEVAVLFADIVGFTPYCEAHEPEIVVAHLQELVELFEDISNKYKMEKIKTIGDAFMATSGLLIDSANPVATCVRAGLEMAAQSVHTTAQWQIRVGIHVGPVIAGVVGRRKYLFDLWGDTVNTAARIERFAKPSSVHVSRPAWESIQSIAQGQSIGMVDIRGKGPMELFQVNAIETTTNS